jgi:hypothetical protein
MRKIVVAFIIAATLLMSGVSTATFTAGQLTTCAWAEGGE